MEGYKLGRASKSVSSRRSKAKKIILLTEGFIDLNKCEVLDIGTGAGYIANELSKRSKSVFSIDIVDDRKIKAGYKHQVVTNEELPFADNSFDLVITNQVLEHVPDQQTHLTEINRVLRPGGIVYLASPNKWWITDPHYKLPFISWLPRPMAEAYLQLFKKRKWDIYSVSAGKLHKLAYNSGFIVNDVAWEVMCNPVLYGVHFPKSVSNILRIIPSVLRKPLLGLVPTHIKILEHKQ